MREKGEVTMDEEGGVNDQVPTLTEQKVKQGERVSVVLVYKTTHGRRGEEQTPHTERTRERGRKLQRPK